MSVVVTDNGICTALDAVSDNDTLCRCDYGAAEAAHIADLNAAPRQSRR
jgi:hypothetical protein